MTGSPPAPFSPSNVKQYFGYPIESSSILVNCAWVNTMEFNLASKVLRILCMLGLTFILSSCMVSNNPNLVGKRANYSYSDDISALRDARRSVQVFSSIPENATNIESIEVQRCHQNFTEDAPTEETLLDDLIIAAYAAGADGISKITHKKRKWSYEELLAH